MEEQEGRPIETWETEKTEVGEREPQALEQEPTSGDTLERMRTHSKQEIDQQLKKTEVATTRIQTVAKARTSPEAQTWAEWGRNQLAEVSKKIKALEAYLPRFANVIPTSDRTPEAYEPPVLSAEERAAEAARDAAIEAQFRPSPEKKMGDVQASVDRFAEDGAGEVVIGTTLESFQKWVNTDFLEKNVAEIRQHLQSGGEHPRWLVQVLHEQLRARVEGDPIPTREEVLMNGTIPQPFHDSYRALSRWSGPEAMAKDAKRARSYLENKYYPQAAELARELQRQADALPPGESLDPALRAVIDALPALAEQQEHVEQTRYENAREKQRACYDAILSGPEGESRREALEARKLTEDVFAKGKLVGPLENLFGGKYTGTIPGVGTFEYTFQDEQGVTRTERRVGVVKLTDAERYSARPGITAGSGPIREATLSLPYIIAGFDNVPTVAARRGLSVERPGGSSPNESYGDVTITEYVPGKSVNRLKDEPWFLQGKEPNPSLFMMRLVDKVIHRTDGGLRNTLQTEDVLKMDNGIPVEVDGKPVVEKAGGEIVPFDFGAEGIPDPADRKRSSVAEQILQKMGRKDTPIDVQKQFLERFSGPAFDVFLESLNGLPENMKKYKEYVQKQRDDIQSRFETQGAEAMEDSNFLDGQHIREDFGGDFHRKVNEQLKKAGIPIVYTP